MINEAENKVFTIKEQELAVSSVTLRSETVTYNGKERTPSLTVKNAAGDTLKAGVDYTFTRPAGRTDAGTYAYVITGKGNYAGTVSKVFTIKAK